jgi:hypothetical protein
MEGKEYEYFQKVKEKVVDFHLQFPRKMHHTKIATVRVIFYSVNLLEYKNLAVTLNLISCSLNLKHYNE